MKKYGKAAKNRWLIVISALLFALLLPPLFLVKSSGRPATAVLLVLSAVLVLLIPRKKAIFSINRGMVSLLTATVGVLFVTVSVASGVLFGFFINPYVSSFVNALEYLIPSLLAIVAMELIRSTVIAQQDFLSTFFVTLAGIVSEIAISTSQVGFASFNNFVDLICMTFFPAITANLLYNYLAKRYGCLPGTLYRIITELYIFVAPYTSAMADSLLSLIVLILPIGVYAFIDLLFEKKRRYSKKPPSKWRYVGIGALLFVMVSVIMLISCQFKYGLLVIGSPSMTGEINKGDAIVYEEYTDQPLAVGDVIVFRKNDVVTVHRIDLITNINGQDRYYTKGDANEERDEGYITTSDIIGITDFKISYIGYPTLWFRDLFSVGS